MKYLWILLIAGIAGAYLMVGSTTVEAIQPTPTLLPTAATPTSAAQYLRHTPTPFPTGDPLIDPFTVNFDGDTTADITINVYNSVNQNHIIDFILFILVAWIIIAMISKIIMSITKDT